MIQNNQMISVVLTPEQYQDLHTGQMMAAVNANHRDAQIRDRDRHYRSYIHRNDRRAKHLAYIRRRNNALAAGMAGLLCLVASLAGLAYGPLFLPIGVACVLWAAVLIGMLAQERKVAKK